MHATVDLALNPDLQIRVDLPVWQAFIRGVCGRCLSFCAPDGAGVCLSFFGGEGNLVGTMSQATRFNGTIGFIGAGRMATALAKGFVAGGRIGACQIHVSDVNAKAGDAFSASVPGSVIEPDNKSVASDCDLLFLAVKPQIAKQALSGIDLSNSQSTIVSVMAGVRIAAIESWLQTRRIIRVMPNTPCLIGSGAIGLSATEEVTSRVREEIVGLLRTVGAVAIVPESLLDAVTGLSGSGPAFVFSFLRGMIEGGRQAGLHPADARLLAIHTVMGAARLLESSGESPQDLIDKVSSRGGTTIEGLQILLENQFENSIANAVLAATRRATELGDEFR